jgi:hypothetical protein
LQISIEDPVTDEAHQVEGMVLGGTLTQTPRLAVPPTIGSRYSQDPVAWLGDCLYGLNLTTRVSIAD